MEKVFGRVELNPAVQTTKHSKRTKNQRLRDSSRLTFGVKKAGVAGFFPFVCLVYFVVPTCPPDPKRRCPAHSTSFATAKVAGGTRQRPERVRGGAPIWISGGMGRTHRFADPTRLSSARKKFHRCIGFIPVARDNSGSRAAGQDPRFVPLARPSGKRLGELPLGNFQCRAIPHRKVGAVIR